MARSTRLCDKSSKKVFLGMKLLGFAGAAPDSALADWRAYQTQCLTPPGAPLVAGSLAEWRASIAGADCAQRSDIMAIVKGQLRWNAPVPGQQGVSQADAVLAAYKAWGDDFLSHLEGGFAVAVVDLAQRRVLLALDRMGVERMTYAATSSAIAFSASAEQLARSPLCKFGLNTQGLYDFLMMHMIPAPNTIFAGVSKLRPGTMAVFENGQVRVRRYWQPKFVEGRTHETFEQWRQALHDGLRGAVQDAQPDERTGAFLSGGLDSSSVAGMLSQVVKGANRKARTFSMGFGVDQYDELHFARIAAKHFDCDAFEYHVTPEDIVTAFPLIAQAYDEPFGNSSAVPTYMCALRAKERGIDHLLAGDGGDEIFGGNERYVRQRVFEIYQRVPALLRHGVFEPLSRLFPPEGGLMPLRKFRSYVDQARIPLPERLESWNFIYRTGIETMLDPDFTRSVDPRAPFAVMDDVYHAAPSKVMLHQMLFYDWHFTLSDNDLRKVGTMCELAGVKVSYPMLDQRVVDLSIRIPPNKKIEGMELRSFYKNAMRGFLPEEILNKTKHGFGLPFGVWLKSHRPLADLIYGHLHDLKQRHIVQASFIDRLIEDHKSGHASYFGYAIWDLAMLEAWLKSHGQM
jgi:asparagine synthase (glutamine-hydrolysing)